ncbi:MAG: hypothetical protein ACRDZO_28750 [Egibacteraceae bacterium]
MSTPWVCLDVGECLIDETRVWNTWARVLGIPAFTLSAVFGGAHRHRRTRSTSEIAPTRSVTALR